MSLRFRLALAVAGTFAVVVVGCVFAAHLSASHELRAETDRFLLQRAADQRIQHELRDFPGGPGGPNGTRNDPPRLAEPDAYVQVIGPDGTILERAPVDLPVDDRDRDLATRRSAPRFRNVTVDHTPYRVLTVHIDGGAAQIARNIQGTDDVLSSLDVRLLLIALGGTVAAALLAWLLAMRIVRPVERLTEATEEVARTQDLAHPIDITRNDELGRLAASFNTMLVALRTSRDQQKRLVMDASHELRTPLTALRTNIEVLQRANTMDDAQRSQLLGDVEVELDEFTELVEELVELATDTRADEPLEVVALSELVQRVVGRMQRHTGRAITFRVDHDANVTVRPHAIERAVANLVENACKFSAPPSGVDVRVDGGAVEIADRGPGIDDADRPYVFDRFYRAPSARAMPGSGLGLAIVRQLVELHGGTVEPRPRDGGGTVARITLPTT